MTRIFTAADPVEDLQEAYWAKGRALTGLESVDACPMVIMHRASYPSGTVGQWIAAIIERPELEDSLVWMGQHGLGVLAAELRSQVIAALAREATAACRVCLYAEDLTENERTTLAAAVEAELPHMAAKAREGLHA